MLTVGERILAEHRKLQMKTMYTCFFPDPKDRKSAFTNSAQEGQDPGQKELISWYLDKRDRDLARDEQSLLQEFERLEDYKRSMKRSKLGKSGNSVGLVGIMRHPNEFPLK